MRVRIEHRTTFDYAVPASASFNEVRLTPRNDEKQNLIEFHLVTEPAARAISYRDHFGTLVHVFDVRRPHERLSVTGRSTVVTYPRRWPGDSAGDLAALDDPVLRDAQAEWLHPSPLASGGDHLYTFAHHVRRVVHPTSVVELVLGVSREVHGRFRYASGTSYVSSTVDDLLERGTGVCQDFAHLAIATLRDLGVPARYVSGYFYAGVGEPLPDVPLAVESHAWVEAFIPGSGWLEVDPTNDCPADERHVTVAVGRDYADVAPLRGVLRGGGGARLSVAVTMVAPSEDASGRLPLLPPVVGPAGALAAVRASGARPARSGAPGSTESVAHQTDLSAAQQQQQQQQGSSPRAVGRAGRRGPSAAAAAQKGPP